MARDEDGVMYVEAGAAVLTDTGMLCVDEFDKMSVSDRAALHEVMEQQHASFAKIGFLLTMKTRISLLAAANPKAGYWDENASLAENVNLPQSLITRFDLIYNLVDEADADRDRMIATHIVLGERPDVLSSEALTAYIRMVRELKPTMSDGVAKVIVQYYVRARLEGGELRVTPRHLEAVKRLAGARAKIYQRTEITEADAKRAIFLVETMIQKTMADPVTGKPDHMKAVSGGSRSAVRLVDEAIASMEGKFTATDVADKVKPSIPDIKRVLGRLTREGAIVERQPGVYERMRRGKTRHS